MQNYKKLRVWIESRVLIRTVYQVTDDFPVRERYNLQIQMRKACVSVSSNIVEGSNRKTERDKIHFYQMAYASASELENQNEICSDVGILESENFELARQQINLVQKMLFSLLAAMRKRQFMNRQPRRDEITK